MNNSSRIARRWTEWTPHGLFFYRRPNHLCTYSRWHSSLFRFRASCHPWIVPRIGSHWAKWTPHGLFLYRRPNHLCTYSRWHSSLFRFRACCHPWIVPIIIRSLRQPHHNIPFQKRNWDHERFRNNSSRIGSHWAKWTPHSLFFRHRPNHLCSYSRWHSSFFRFRGFCHPWLVPIIIPSLRHTHHNISFQKRNWDHKRFMNNSSRSGRRWARCKRRDPFSCHSQIFPRIGRRWATCKRRDLFSCHSQIFPWIIPLLYELH